MSLTDPNEIPLENTVDPHPLPPVASSAALLANAVNQITSLSSNPNFSSNKCALCQAILEVGKFVALAAPDKGPEFFIEFCTITKLSSTCNTTYGLTTGIGSVITQVVANADVGGLDGQVGQQNCKSFLRPQFGLQQALCQNFFGLCPAPATLPLNLTGWFAKPKPSPLPPPKQPSGKRLNVLHLSDFHLDPSELDHEKLTSFLWLNSFLIGYATGAESNCTTGLCCRANGFNSKSPNSTLSPAPRFGAFLWYAAL